MNVLMLTWILVSLYLQIRIAEALAGPDREEWIKSIEKEMQVFRDRRIYLVRLLKMVEI